MNAVLLPIAFCAGIAIALQTTLNGQLARGIGGDPLTASLVSFIIGATCLGLVALLRGGASVALATISDQPVWTLLGGALGAGALLCYVILAPRIGLTLLVAFAIAGQLSASLVIDHFALLGATAHPVSSGKLVGYGLILLGLAAFAFEERITRVFYG